jgi:4-hydroxy-3-polyprenylbenzoate decarboxylase
LTFVSIKQRYPGHAKQVGLLASQCLGAAYLGRYVIVVDEDIDIFNNDEVLWALATRSDPQESIDIVRRCWSGPLDPAIPLGKKGLNSRAIIEACRPYEWIDSFPRSVESSPETKERIMRKWGKTISM